MSNLREPVVFQKLDRLVVIAALEKKAASLDKEIARVEKRAPKPTVSEKTQAARDRRFHNAFKKAARRILAMNTEKFIKVIYPAETTYNHKTHEHDPTGRLDPDGRYCEIKNLLPAIPHRPHDTGESAKNEEIGKLRARKKNLERRATYLRAHSDKLVNMSVEFYAQLVEGLV